MYQRTKIRQGMTVMSRDGVQIGRVVDVTAASIIIEKGHFFFLRDFELPLSDISMVRGDEIILLRDHAELRRADSGTEKHEGTAKDSARFLQPAGGSTPVTDEARSLPDEELIPPVTPAEEAYHPIPHEPPLSERRAAGPGWDPLSVDEELEKEAPRTSGPDPKAPTRY